MSTTYAPRARRSFVRAAAVAAVACSLSAGSLLVLETGSASSAAAAALPVTPTSMPMYAHMPIPSPANIQLHINEGWATGAFLYYPSHETFGWTTKWDELAAAFPDGVDLFVSPKKFTAESLRNWAEKLSPAQRAKTVFAYFQEPEDNHLTEAQQADFRAKVTLAASIVQPYGIRNGIEMQSWTVNDANTQPWAGKPNFKNFIPEDESTIDFVGISLYDIHQNFSGADQLRPVVNLLDRNLPDAAWGPVASGWSVPVGTPLGDPLRQVRADAADAGFAYALRRDATAFGWWNWKDWEGVKDFYVGTDRPLLDMLMKY